MSLSPDGNGVIPGAPVDNPADQSLDDYGDAQSHTSDRSGYDDDQDSMNRTLEAAATYSNDSHSRPVTADDSSVRRRFRAVTETQSDLNLTPLNAAFNHFERVVFNTDLEGVPDIKFSVDLESGIPHSEDKWGGRPDGKWWRLRSSLEYPPTKVFAPPKDYEEPTDVQQVEVIEGVDAVELPQPLSVPAEYANASAGVKNRILSALATLDTRPVVHGEATIERDVPALPVARPATPPLLSEDEVYTILSEEPRSGRGLAVKTTPGVGKSTCCDYFRRLGVPVFETRDLPRTIEMESVISGLMDRGFSFVSSSGRVLPQDRVYVYPSLDRCTANVFHRRRNVRTRDAMVDYLQNVWKPIRDTPTRRVYLPDGCHLSDYFWSVLFSTGEKILRGDDSTDTG